MNKGFTLLELLVVVLIIGILASIALPQYTKAVEKARATEAIQMLGDLATAEQIYQMGFGKYIADLDQLDLEIPGSVNATTAQTKNFKVTLNAPNTGAEFVASAERGSLSGTTFNVNTTSEPKYAIMLQIDASGTISRYCADTAASAVASLPTSTSNKWCKSIANNTTGVIR